VLGLPDSDTSVRPKRIPTQNSVTWKIWTLFPSPFGAVKHTPAPGAARAAGCGAEQGPVPASRRVALPRRDAAPCSPRLGCCTALWCFCLLAEDLFGCSATSQSRCQCLPAVVTSVARVPPGLSRAPGHSVGATPVSEAAC